MSIRFICFFVTVVPKKSYLKKLFKSYFHPFQPSVVFHIENNHLTCSANQMNGFYIKCNTGLKWPNPISSRFFTRCYNVPLKCTELTKYIWQLKRNKKNPNIEWKIVRKVFCDAKSCVYCA